MEGLKDIYFYNAMELATELRDNTLSSHRAIKHLIASIVIFGAGIQIPISIEFSEINIDIGQLLGYLVMYIVIGVISYYGSWLTYQVNQKGDGKDFFMRFAVLTLPIGIQLTVLFLWVGLLFAAVAYALTTTLGIYGAYISLAGMFIGVPLITAMYFIRLRKYIAIAAGAGE